MTTTEETTDQTIDQATDQAAAPAIDMDMLVPLLVMALGFTAWFATALLLRLRVALLETERGAAWVQSLRGGHG